MSSLKLAGQWAALLAVSAALAWALEQAALPAALLLGPMVAGILFGVGGARVRISGWAFLGAQAVIGCLIARAITVSILVSIAGAWASMLLVVAMTVIAGGIVGWVLVKAGTLPGTTAAWGSSPGGAAAMVAMAEEFGADPRLVAFMQYLRVAFVVLTASLVSRLLIGADPAPAPGMPAAMPFQDNPAPLLETLAIAAGGALIGRLFAIPAGALIVPMAIGILFQTTGAVTITLPNWLLGGAYGLLGWYVGLRFTPEVVTHALRAVPHLLVSTFALIGLCALSAWALTWLLHTDGLTAYLATSPGGLDSVAIIAVGSNADIPFVMATQTLRLFVVIVTGPILAKLISKYA